MANVTKSIDVQVPVRTAYNQWTQFESFPHFMEGVEEVRQLFISINSGYPIGTLIAVETEADHFEVIASGWLLSAHSCYQEQEEAGSESHK